VGGDVPPPLRERIGDGTLSRDRFEFYLKQDYVYLIDFSRVFALASAKSRTLTEMGTFRCLAARHAEHGDGTPPENVRRLRIAEEELAMTRKSPITSAYTDLLVRTAYEGGVSDILAVLLPCACGYVEIGKRLKSEGLPEDRFYREWIDTYSSPEFQEFADGLVGRMNEHAPTLPRTAGPLASPVRIERPLRIPVLRHELEKGGGTMTDGIHPDGGGFIS